MHKQIGANLKAARLEAGMNQVVFGTLIGVSAQQVVKLERGDNRLSFANAVTICRELGIKHKQLRKGL